MKKLNPKAILPLASSSGKWYEERLTLMTSKGDIGKLQQRKQLKSMKERLEQLKKLEN